MTKAEEYQRIILDVNDWFQKRKEQLELILNKKSGGKILFEGENGQKVELPENLKEGFFMGVQIALETFGEFPVKITKQ